MLKLSKFSIIAVTLGLGLFANLGAAENISQGITIEALSPLPLELTKSWQIGKVKANAAWIKPVTGVGVRVGVIDTGVFNHAELSGGRLLSGWNFVRNTAINANTNSDDNGHGTHVSGIIAANSGAGSVVGVAPDASIIPIKVLDSRGSGSLVNLSKGLAYSLTQNARIVNMSLGWDGLGNAGVEAQLKANVTSTAVINGQVIVVAAGNSSQANPSWPARYASQPWANGQMIVVGAVDQNNAMPSWSNKAGDAMNFYLVAPGVNIYSTTNRANNYATLSGTSMATPVVSGAAALIASYWPYLKANSIVDILLKTSTDLGTKGVDNIYGWGLLNIDQAMNPVVAPMSTPIVPLASGTYLPLNTNTPNLPQAYLNALAHADLKIAALDSYGRDYTYDLSSIYKERARPLQLATVFSGMDTRMRAINSETENTKFRMIEVEPEYSNALMNEGLNKPVLISMAMTKKINDDHLIAFGINTSANHFSGFSDTPLENHAFIANKAFDNPYLSFNSNPNYFGYGLSLGDGLSMRSGVTFSQDTIQAQGGLSNHDFKAGFLNQAAIKNTATFVEIAKKWDQTKVAFSSGMSSENKSMLGGSPGSVLAVNGETETQFVTLSIATPLQNNTWFAASYDRGYSHLRNQKDSLLDSARSITSEAWSLGVIKTKNFTDRDSLGFAISQPMAAMDGQLNLTLPVGMNVDGGMTFEKRLIDMKPQRLERDFELSYFNYISNTTSLSLSGMYRIHPGNDENAPPEGLLALRWCSFF